MIATTIDPNKLYHRNAAREVVPLSDPSFRKLEKRGVLTPQRPTGTENGTVYYSGADLLRLVNRKDDADIPDNAAKLTSALRALNFTADELSGLVELMELDAATKSSGSKIREKYRRIATVLRTVADNGAAKP